jgi:DNA-directed RNA polymerase specialized sigma24 family protein
VDEITAPAGPSCAVRPHSWRNQRAAIVTRELEGCSYDEIAEVLDINVSALETLLFRARRELSEQLEEQLTGQ